MADERVSRQQPEGDSAERREGRHHRHARGGVDARPRHAVRPVAAALRQHPVLPEVEQRPALGRRCQDAGSRTTRRVRLDAVPNVFASPVGAAGRVYFAGREGKTLVIRHGPTLEIVAVNELSRRLRRVAGARGQRDLPARIQVLYLRFGTGLDCGKLGTGRTIPVSTVEPVPSDLDHRPRLQRGRHDRGGRRPPLRDRSAGAARNHRRQRRIARRHDGDVLDGLAAAHPRTDRRPRRKRIAGRGMRCASGSRRAGGSVVAIQDADLELDPAQLAGLVTPILNGETTVVYGSRFLDGRPEAPPLTIAANRFLTWLTNVLYGAALTDMETCYKIMRADVVRSLDADGRPFRHRAGDHGEAAARRPPDPRASRAVHAAVARRRQEDQLAGRADRDRRARFGFDSPDPRRAMMIAADLARARAARCAVIAAVGRDWRRDRRARLGHRTSPAGRILYCYINQAELFVQGRVHDPQPIVAGRAVAGPREHGRAGRSRRRAARRRRGGADVSARIRRVARGRAVDRRPGRDVLGRAALRRARRVVHVPDRPARGRRAAGVLAAVLLATSPAFLYQVVQPMSDVPAAADVGGGARRRRSRRRARAERGSLACSAAPRCSCARTSRRSGW